MLHFQNKNIRKVVVLVVFFNCSEEIIKQGGVVFGVKWNENLVTTHDYCEAVEGLKEFRTSKYVQARLKVSI